MAGIYVHIPFCKQACIYCNFHFSTVLNNKAALLEGIAKEVALRQDYLPDTEVVDTLYFGGGTPSLLTEKELGQLIEQVDRFFPLQEGAEITLEGNPDDLQPEKLRSFLRLGINRLSIGVQSFFEKDLQWMNRAHDARQAIACLEAVRKTGFTNFSADLIFGLPELTDDRWKENIARMTELAVPHLSCYGLTLEPRTPLAHQIQHRKIPPLDEQQAARQFEILMEQLAAAGYEQYEISNFARPGRRSRHNSSYWHNIPYLGLGPGAHSFRPQERQWNVANNSLYLKSIARGQVPCEKEILLPDMQWNEYVMTALRTVEGCDLRYMSTRFGAQAAEALKTASLPFIDQGQLTHRADGHLVLTTKGKLFADGIAAALFR